MIKLILIVFIAFLGLMIGRMLFNSKWSSFSSDEFSDIMFSGIENLSKSFHGENIFRFTDAKLVLNAKLIWFIIFSLVIYFFRFSIIWELIGLYLILLSVSDRIHIKKTAKYIVNEPTMFSSLILYGKVVTSYYQIFLTVVFYIFVIIR